MVVLDCPISSQSWKDNGVNRNGNSRLPLEVNGNNTLRDSKWDECFDKIDRLRYLGNAWDGDVARSPNAATVSSAIELVSLFRRFAVPVPGRIAPGLGGEVILEWHFPDGTYAEVEIVRPYFAEVMVFEPGKSARHWTLPTD